MTKQIANILTGCRILGSVLLLFPPVFSVTFYIIYLFCGFSDMIDGTVARKTNSTSELGSCLDTAADIVFVSASMVTAACDGYSPVAVDMGRGNCGC